MTPDKPQMPDEIWAKEPSRKDGGMYWLHDRGPTVKYVRTDLCTRAPLPDDRARASECEIVEAQLNWILWELETYFGPSLNADLWEAVMERIRHKVNIARSALRAALSASVPAVNVEALKREVYRNHIKKAGWTDEMIDEELAENPDWEYGYQYGGQQSVEEAIDYLATRGLPRSASVEDVEGLDEAIKIGERVLIQMEYTGQRPDKKVKDQALQAHRTLLAAAKKYLSQTGRLDVKGGE